MIALALGLSASFSTVRAADAATAEGANRGDTVEEEEAVEEEEGEEHIISRGATISLYASQEAAKASIYHHSECQGRYATSVYKRFWYY